MSLNHSADLSRAATEARGLAMDAVAACHSGHLGLPLGAAEIGAVLYGDFLRHDPAAPLGSTATASSSRPDTARCSSTAGSTSPVSTSPSRK
ncbi:transketolase [Verrucomicrobiota bacterium]|nr:transketolase [Verrucomicrobiota bacterium]